LTVAQPHPQTTRLNLGDGRPEDISTGQQVRQFNCSAATISALILDALAALTPLERAAWRTACPSRSAARTFSSGWVARAGVRNGHHSPWPSTALPRSSHAGRPAVPLPKRRQQPTIRRSRPSRHDRGRPASHHADEVRPGSPVGFRPRRRGGAGTGQRRHQPHAGQRHQGSQPTLAADCSTVTTKLLR
jgi:hypothetical protein